MGRAPCCSKQGLNRGTWTSSEDRVLAAYIRAHGEGNWRHLPKRAGLKRCGKSCRLRWMNYLRPDIKRGNISPDEEDLILRLHRLLGNRWSMIARRLPGRTDNEIKNYWNATLGKKAKAQSSLSSSSPSLPPLTSSKTDRVTAQHQIIRTKATRCTRVVLPAAPEAIKQTKIDDQLESGSLDPNDIGFLNSYVPMDAHDQVMLMEAPQFGAWAENGLDLESLAFLLDSSEWPLQENQPCFF